MTDDRPALFTDNDVLIVIDVQNDFCPGGALAVPHGDEVVPIVNRLAAKFRSVVLTQDARRGGFAVFVIEDACRGIDLDGSVAATRASFATLGISCLKTAEFGSGMTA
jgi:nicotinamidase-related amidase